MNELQWDDIAKGVGGGGIVGGEAIEGGAMEEGGRGLPLIGEGYDLDQAGEGKSPRGSEAPPALSVKARKEGLHIDGSLLWFDAPSCSDVCFLSRLPRYELPQFGTRFITSPGVVDLLCSGRRRKTNEHRLAPMVCDYGRPFSIGSYEVEFLRSGVELGASSIHVQSSKSKHGSCLYAPYAMPCSSQFLTQGPLKKSHTLILTSPCPDLTSPLLDKQQALHQLYSYLQQYHQEHGEYPLLALSHVGLAQEVLHFFSQQPQPMDMAVYPSIHGVNQVYEKYHISLGAYRRYHHTAEGPDTLVMIPLKDMAKLRMKDLKGAALVCVTDNLARYRKYRQYSFFKKHFLVNQDSTVEDFKETLLQVQPRRVLVTGSNIKHYMQVLDASFDLPSHVSVMPVYTDSQPTLFDLIS